MYLLDTNVISELRKPEGRCDPSVYRWGQQVSAHAIYLSVVTIGELSYGIAKAQRKDADKARVYAAWLAKLEHEHRRRILTITAEVARVWGPLSVPDPISVQDGLIAATALVHQLVVVTRNVSDFAATGVRLLNPWEINRDAQ